MEQIQPSQDTLIKQGLFSFEPSAEITKPGFEDPKLKESDLDKLFMKDLIEDIIITEDNSIPPVYEPQQQVILEMKEEIKDEALSNIFKKKDIDITAVENISFDDILKHITSDTVTKTVIIQFSSHVSNFTQPSLDEFFDFLSVDTRFFNLCQGPGFINLIKPLFQLSTIFSYAQAEKFDHFFSLDIEKEIDLRAESEKQFSGNMVDKFLLLFKNNLDLIIFDKKTYKIIEKLLKLTIESKFQKEIEQTLLDDIFKYASNQYSCHVLKVMLSISPLVEKTSEYIYNQLKENLLKYSQNKSSCSLVISSLYVSLNF